MPLQGNTGLGISPKWPSFTTPRGWGQHTVDFPGARRSEYQISLPHNTRRTGHPPPLPVPVLQQVGTSPKPSKYDSPPVLLVYLKSCQCVSQPHPTGKIRHDRSPLLITPTPRRIHWVQIWKHIVMIRRYRINLWHQCLSGNIHGRRPLNHNIWDAHLHDS